MNGATSLPAAQEVRRKRLAARLVKRLRAASDALSAYMLLCNSTGYTQPREGGRDSRQVLLDDISEYTAWVDKKELQQ